MKNKETDRLLRRISEGDEDAFAEFYTATKNGVYAFLFGYFGNAYDTEDAMQTVYLKVKSYISQYKHGTNGRAWLLQIAKNTALNELKKQSRVVCKEEVVPDTPVIGDGSVFDAMRRALAADEREIVVLHVLWGLKHREIADRLDCPVGTITSKYKRAMAKLKEALKEDE